MSNYDANHDNVLEPADLAKVMIDTYRGMNRHFIPTGYELSTYARYFFLYPEFLIKTKEELFQGKIFLQLLQGFSLLTQHLKDDSFIPKILIRSC